MICVVDMFARLSERLATFGEDTASRRVVAKACEANEWFSPAEICYAVEAIRERMLDSKEASRWIAKYSPRIETVAPRRVGIIMAGNIPLVGLADLLYVLSCGYTAVVKPSSKDRSLIDYVVSLIRTTTPEAKIEYLTDATAVDAIIATGSDDANRYFGERFASIPPSNRLFRGSRSSLAVLSGEETAERLAALSDDVFLYSGLGCRNVSLIATPRGGSLQLPVRRMCQAYHNNFLQTRALSIMRGEAIIDTGECIITSVATPSFPRELSRINVVEYDTMADVESFIDANADKIQCVVTDIPTIKNRVPLGEAQRPRIDDYADGVDVMEFLLNLR